MPPTLVAMLTGPTGFPFLLYVTEYVVLPVKPFKVILPLVPLQVVGLLLDVVLMDGVGLTVTSTVAAGDVQPATVCVTEYVPP